MLTDEQREHIRSLVALAHTLAEGDATDEERTAALDRVDGLAEEDRSTVRVVMLYIIDMRARRACKSRARARRLLARFLSPAQAAELRVRKSFVVTGSEGGRYRLYPSIGTIHAIERHGTRDWAIAAFCYHEAADAQIPDQDLTLAHMALLRADEGAFLAQANVSRFFKNWDGPVRRRLAEIAVHRAAHRLAVGA